MSSLITKIFEVGEILLSSTVSSPGTSDSAAKSTTTSHGSGTATPGSSFKETEVLYSSLLLCVVNCDSV